MGIFSDSDEESAAYDREAIDTYRNTIQQLRIRISLLENVAKAAQWVLTHPERAGRMNYLREALEALTGGQE